MRDDAIVLRDWLSGTITNFVLKVLNDQNSGNVCFVQVGANDGSYHDPISRTVRDCHWKGLLIEPVPYFFNKLKENYADQSGLEFLQVACGDCCGTHLFYQVKPAVREIRSDLLGVSSLDYTTIRKHFSSDEDFKHYVEEISIDVVTLDQIIEERAIAKLEILVVDAEGSDWRVIQGLDFNKTLPTVVLVEHIHLGNLDRHAMRRKFLSFGYIECILALDTIYFQPDLLLPKERGILQSFAGLLSF